MIIPLGFLLLAVSQFPNLRPRSFLPTFLFQGNYWGIAHSQEPSFLANNRIFLSLQLPASSEPISHTQRHQWLPRKACKLRPEAGKWWSPCRVSLHWWGSSRFSQRQQFL